MGKYNSSTYRVEPLIEYIKNDLTKINEFLNLLGIGVDSLPYEYFYGSNEKVLKPTKKHLVELVNYIATKENGFPKTTNEDRVEFYSKDKDLKEKKRLEAIMEIEKIYDSLPSETRKWFIFEGFTHPDIYIEGKDYILLGEGKWTENHITTETTNLRTKIGERRNQMIRHIQAALNLNSGKKIYAFYLVDKECGYLLDLTKESFNKQIDDETITVDNKEEILNSFVGYTTWQDIKELFPDIEFKTKKEIDKDLKKH
jgi:hypothetical protein